MNDFTQSALYIGNVRHRRFTPTRHDFSYKLFLSWINLKVSPRLNFLILTIRLNEIQSSYDKQGRKI